MGGRINYKNQGKLPKLPPLFLFFAMLVVLLSTASVSADGGLIPFQPFSIYEPGQKAIIAWDEQVEVMILSVDVFGAEDTKALHMVPFPSLPEVELGDISAFENIEEIINSKSRKEGWFLGDNPSQGGGGNFTENIEIIFHERIGPHDITIVRVNFSHEFTDWVNNFLDSQGIENKTMPDNLNEVIEHYIQQDIRFFAFDVIDIDPNEKSVDPIIYTFESDCLYFPLKISSIIDGDTEVTLAFIMPKDVAINTSQMENLGFYNGIEMMLSHEELSEIDSKIADLFADDARLSFFRQSFHLKDLSRDIKLDKIYGVRFVYFRDGYYPVNLLPIIVVASVWIVIICIIIKWPP